MKNFRINSIALLWLCLCLLIARAAMADDAPGTVQFNVKPSSCVALHKGQRCFQSIRIFWITNDRQDYCLYSDTHERKLFCSTSGDAEFIHKYASETSETFSLRLTTSGLTVALASVNTAWVYRTSKRSSSGWRLF